MRRCIMAHAPAKTGRTSCDGKSFRLVFSKTARTGRDEICLKPGSAVNNSTETTKPHRAAWLAVILVNAELSARRKVIIVEVKTNQSGR
jgi:hypothetical protein